MPATETTWRDLKLMHVVFGVSSVVMLVTTIWMLADDHNREWKSYQLQFQDIETWTAQARIDEQQSEDFRRKRVELEQQLAAARAEPLNVTLVQEFVDEARRVEADQEELAEIEEALAEYQSSVDGGEEQLESRDELLEALRDLTARRRFREDNLTREVKVVRAELDKSRADYDIAVGKAQPEEELARLKSTYDEILARLEGPPDEGQAVTGEEAGLVARLQEAKLHREELERLYNEITARENAVRKELAEHMQELELLHTALLEREPNIGKRILSMPVLDAFGSPLKIDQIWLPLLTLNNNFRDVARFDRCTTCHQAMDKTQPGSATLPGYPEERQVVLELQSPTKEQADEILDAVDARHQQEEEEGLVKSEHAKQNERLAELYGFRIAERGLLEEDDATVNVVLPETRAALGGLMSADVLEFVGDAKIVSQEDAFQYLVGRTEWTPLTLTVRRGLPHPFSTHPRLDLFVGSTSPHPMGRFGCTICHQGQGSATSFEWASHTPDTLEEADEWSRQHGWFPGSSRRRSSGSCSSARGGSI
jgi:hypothetical protein